MVEQAQWEFSVPTREFFLVASPMTGMPELNLPVIRAVIKWLDRVGIVAFNPFADYAPDALEKLDQDFFTSRYIPAVTHPRCLGVIALPGWEGSHGATTEVIMAERFHKPQFVYRVAIDPDDGHAQAHLETLKREAICV